MTNDPETPSKSVTHADIFASSADSIRIPQCEVDSAKIKALRAAAKIGAEALRRGDFKEFDDAVELAVHLLETT
jgi:hypothetical protein